jgi:hypothetical protein
MGMMQEEVGHKLSVIFQQIPKYAKALTGSAAVAFMIAELLERSILRLVETMASTGKRCFNSGLS